MLAIPHVTPEEILAAAEGQLFGNENTGICISCGNFQDGCEPDARRYVCEDCGKRTVYGAQELVVMGYAG